MHCKSIFLRKLPWASRLPTVLVFVLLPHLTVCSCGVARLVMLERLPGALLVPADHHSLVDTLSFNFKHGKKLYFNSMWHRPSGVSLCEKPAESTSAGRCTTDQARVIALNVSVALVQACSVDPARAMQGEVCWSGSGRLTRLFEAGAGPQTCQNLPRGEASAVGSMCLWPEQSQVSLQIAVGQQVRQA